MTNISAIKRRENRQQRPHRPHHHSASPSTSSQGEDELNDGEKTSKPTNGGPDGQKLYRDAATDDDRHWTPTLSTAFKILVSLRMSAGIWSPISDCDEVFNYWEPLHLLLYGHGLQTWEYSPVYAIRSWAYILLHAFPLRLFQTILPHTKVTTFFYLRCFLGFACGAMEAYLYRVLCKRLGNGIGRLFVFFTAVSSGMFVASTAFLPSSFSMILNGLSLALWLDGRLFLAVLCTAVSALVGWPFAAILGLPIVAHFIQKNQLLRFTGYALLCGLSVCGFLLAVDTHYYGKTVLAPLNIVLYNVFSEHGPSLYGTEPFSFYVNNLLLNWNIVFPLSLVGLPSGAAYFYLCRSPAHRPTVSNSGAAEDFSHFAPVLYLSLSMFLWMVIFFSQPHKEERFLFPIYPLLAVNAAFALDALHQLSHRWLINFPQLRSVSNYALASSLILFMVTSGSRSLGLYRNYHAPFDVYMALGEKLGKGDLRLNATRNHVEAPVYQVCVGKEWYRFPSSFFLPEEPKFRLAFVESEFKGLLPKYFNTTMDSTANGQDVDVTTTRMGQHQIQHATSRIPDTMNDGNIQERDRFISSLTACDLLVDLDIGRTSSDLEPNYSQNSVDWTPIESQPFLLKAASPSPLLRAFYIPYISARRCVYGAYNLLLSTRYEQQRSTKQQQQQQQRPSVHEASKQ